MKYLVTLTTLIALASCGGSQTTRTVSTNVVLPGNTTESQTLNETPDAFRNLLNAERAAAGSGPVTSESRLQLAAQGHADAMLRGGFFSHTGEDGSTIGSRVTATGYRFVAVAENIAKGQGTMASVMDSWTNSPGHHANNINDRYTQYGFGSAGTGNDKVWVLVLATGS